MPLSIQLCYETIQISIYIGSIYLFYFILFKKTLCMHRRDIKGSGLSIMAEINKSTTKTIKKKAKSFIRQITNCQLGSWKGPNNP